MSDKNKHLTDDQKNDRIKERCEKLRDPATTEEECHKIVEDIWELKGFKVT
ncbi:MAG: hypothetical protein JWM74_5980 [Myxococcaceae bacterium]|nr:hypothetical protein [Myxococcaceae bacterium]